MQAFYFEQRLTCCSGTASRYLRSCHEQLWQYHAGFCVLLAGSEEQAKSQESAHSNLFLPDCQDLAHVCRSLLDLTKVDRELLGIAWKAISSRQSAAGWRQLCAYVVFVLCNPRAKFMCGLLRFFEDVADYACRALNAPDAAVREWCPPCMCSTVLIRPDA